MKLEVLLWASVALANPLRLDINIHVDEQKSSCATEETQPLTTNLPVVELLYEKHRASPPQVVSASGFEKKALTPRPVQSILLQFQQYTICPATYWQSPLQSSKIH